jgi:homoserine dehydrogenase
MSVRTAPPHGNLERRRPHGGAPIGVALLGCGTVGGGVLRLLSERAAVFEDRLGVPLAVRKVLVRDDAKPRVPELDRALITTNPDDILADPGIEIVVEVMGGVHPAAEIVSASLGAGRSVVTANKALLASEGPRLLELAADQRVDLAFEAAVGGGIPIIRTLRDAFASDEVLEMVGILNGTSNYVLTRMCEEGTSFDDALADAQARGYAEADPSLDVDGHDAAHKLLVLSMLAFGTRPPAGMVIEGIRGLDRVDVAFAERFGFTIKHLCVGRDHGSSVELRAHPTLVRKTSVLSNISGVLNAIRLEGRALGPCLLSGRGAGDMPTAVSVVADVLDVARSIVAGVPGLSTGSGKLATRPLLPNDEVVLRHYLRLTVRDQPGVMGKIATALGEAGVSLSEIVQTQAKDASAEIVLVTHRARAGGVRAALDAIAAERFVTRPPVVLRIEEV